MDVCTSFINLQQSGDTAVPTHGSQRPLSLRVGAPSGGARARGAGKARGGRSVHVSDVITCFTRHSMLCYNTSKHTHTNMAGHIINKSVNSQRLHSGFDLLIGGRSENPRLNF